jgi:hypothetical protein
MADEDQPSLPTADTLDGTPTAQQLKKLKRRRATQRAHATRFISAINAFTNSTEVEEIEHNRDRLRETLQTLTELDEPIQDLLSDKEYEEDTSVCEEYIDKAKRAIQRASRCIEGDPSASAVRLSWVGPTQLTDPAPAGRITLTGIHQLIYNVFTSTLLNCSTLL